MKPIGFKKTGNKIEIKADHEPSKKELEEIGKKLAENELEKMLRKNKIPFKKK
jgi:TusA-related sulfurtransferase